MGRYEKQRTTSELKENVCVAPISVPTTLYSGVHTLPCPKSGLGTWKKRALTPVPGGVRLKGTKSERCLRIRKHNLKRPKQPQ